MATPSVRLRPFRPDELAVLWAQQRADALDAGKPPSPAARRRLKTLVERSGRLVNGRLDLGVVAGGRLVGHIEARQPRHAMPRGVFEIGIELLPAERGKGYGRAALTQFTELLMREHEAHRVQASTALDNAAMRRVFELVGYSFEGVLRALMKGPGGELEDYALYAFTVTDRDGRPR